MGIRNTDLTVCARKYDYRDIMHVDDVVTVYVTIWNHRIRKLALDNFVKPVKEKMEYVDCYDVLVLALWLKWMITPAMSFISQMRFPYGSTQPFAPYTSTHLGSTGNPGIGA